MVSKTKTMISAMWRRIWEPAADQAWAGTPTIPRLPGTKAWRLTSAVLKGNVVLHVSVFVVADCLIARRRSKSIPLHFSAAS